MTATYEEFLVAKRPRLETSGRVVSDEEVNPRLFPFQRDLTRWSVQKGRAALFADAGLGKTPMQLEWARLTGQRTLILAPLSVARQTVQIGHPEGVMCERCHHYMKYFERRRDDGGEW